MLILLLIIDPFPAWKPPLCHKEPAKCKKCPFGDFLALICVFMASESWPSNISTNESTVPGALTNESAQLYARMTEYHNWPDTPQDMIGYDWHEGEEISHRGEGEFSPDFLTRWDKIYSSS